MPRRPPAACSATARGRCGGSRSGILPAMAPAKGEHAVVEAGGRELRVSNPGKLYFPQAGLTKMDLVNYYLECEEAVVRHLRERPTVMKRWVDGVEGKPFFQKRVPETAPDWLETATLPFPPRPHPPPPVPTTPPPP